MNLKFMIILFTLIGGVNSFADDRPTVEEFLEMDGEYEQKELVSIEEVKNYLKKNIAYGGRASLNSYGAFEVQAILGSKFFNESLELGMSAAAGTGFYISTYRFGPYAQVNIKFSENRFFVRISREYSSYRGAEYNHETGDYDLHRFTDWQTHTTLGLETPSEEGRTEYTVSIFETEDQDGEMKTHYNFGFGLKF